MTKRIIYLVRHGERLDAVDKKWHGEKYNSPLSPLGFEQVQQLGERLRDEPIDLIVSSPYLRALQTTNAIAEARNQRFIVDAGIGEWQGKSMMPSPPKITLPSQQDFPLMDLHHEAEVNPIWGESVPQVFERYRRAVQALLDQYDGNILVVGHGRTVTGTAHVLTGKPESSFKYHLAGLTMLREGWTLELNSDTSHIRSGCWISAC